LAAITFSQRHEATKKRKRGTIIVFAAKENIDNHCHAVAEQRSACSAAMEAEPASIPLRAGLLLQHSGGHAERRSAATHL